MRNLFMVLLLHMSSILISQNDLKVVDTEKFKFSYIVSKYLGNQGDTLFYQYLIITDKLQFGTLKYQSMGLVMLNRDFKEISKIELHGKEKKEKSVDIYFKNGITYIISKHNEDKNTIVKIYGYDLSGNVTLEKEIMKIDKDQGLEIDYSSDSTKIVIFSIKDRNNKNEDCMLEVCVFDYEANELWRRNIKYSNSDKIEILELNANNDGSISLVKLETSKDNSNGYKIIQYNKNNLNSTTLDHSGTIGHLNLYESMGNLYLTGFNFDEEKKIYINPFLASIDPSLKVLKIPNEEIKADLLEEFIKEKFYKEKKGWEGYIQLAHAWENEKGEHRVVWHEYYTSSQRVSGILYEYYEVKNYFLFTFDNDNKLVDIKLCPMNIVTDSQLGKPIQSFVSNDKLYFTYNEFENNIDLPKISNWKNKGDNMPILRQFEPSGKIKDIRLNQNLKNQMMLPNLSGMTDDGKIVFNSCEVTFFKIKNYKMGSISLKSFD